MTVTGAEQLTEEVKFKLTKQDAVLRVVVPAAHVTYAAGKFETPAAATQACRPNTVVGIEQLTAVVEFWLTRQEAAVRTVVFVAQVASVVGRLDTPATAAQA